MDPVSNFPGVTAWFSQFLPGLWHVELQTGAESMQHAWNCWCLGHPGTWGRWRTETSMFGKTKRGFSVDFPFKQSIDGYKPLGTWRHFLGQLMLLRFVTQVVERGLGVLFWWGFPAFRRAVAATLPPFRWGLVSGSWWRWIDQDLVRYGQYTQWLLGDFGGWEGHHVVGPDRLGLNVWEWHADSAGHFGRQLFRFQVHQRAATCLCRTSHIVCRKISWYKKAASICNVRLIFFLHCTSESVPSHNHQPGRITS